jgi:hypothetical protein
LEPVVSEKVLEAIKAYFFTPAKKPTLINPVEAQDAIRGLKFGDTPGPNGIFSSGRHPSLSRY